jgi:hypothetical protein
MAQFTGPISGVVPLILVADIERSAAFYGLLGFEIGNHQPRTGEKHWAWLYAPQASDWRRGSNLMLTRGEGRPVDVKPGTTTLYLYAVDVVSTHANLIAMASTLVPSCTRTTCLRASLSYAIRTVTN